MIMRILEVCPYSAGGCGVWARVKQESLELSKRGHEIKIFSSYFEKGTNKIVTSKDKLGKIEIKRFPAKRLGGESFMLWDFEKEALEYSPDVIIVHNYRHLHTTRALKIVKKLNSNNKKCKIFLVTHAPFVEGNITRTIIQSVLVSLYDKFIAPRTLNKFNGILAISNWEIPYLIKAGAKKQKIFYIPNGIPADFFNQPNNKKDKNILFLGRISPKKKIETIIESMIYVKDKEVKLEIVGPKEEEYYKKLLKLIIQLKLEDRIIFSNPIYKLKDKIRKIDSCKIYILASRVEGMPQGLIEAMAREKIVIGSDSMAIRDLIIDKKNGYLFEFNNPKSLAEKINYALISNKQNDQIKIKARNFVKKFSWDIIINDLLSVLK